MDLPCVQFPGHFNLLLSSHSMNHWITNAWPNTYWNNVVVLVLWTDDSDKSRGDTLYYFEVAFAPPMSNSATPMMILHPQGQGI